MPRKARPRMYRKGAPIKTLDDVAKAIAQRQYLILRDRSMHPSWFNNMGIGPVLRFINNGKLFWAVRNKRKDGK